MTEPMVSCLRLGHAPERGQCNYAGLVNDSGSKRTKEEYQLHEFEGSARTPRQIKRPIESISKEYVIRRISFQEPACSPFQ